MKNREELILSLLGILRLRENGNTGEIDIHNYDLNTDDYDFKVNLYKIVKGDIDRCIKVSDYNLNNYKDYVIRVVRENCRIIDNISDITDYIFGYEPDNTITYIDAENDETIHTKFEQYRKDLTLPIDSNSKNDGMLLHAIAKPGRGKEDISFMFSGNPVLQFKDQMIAAGSNVLGQEVSFIKLGTIADSIFINTDVYNFNNKFEAFFDMIKSINKQINDSIELMQMSKIFDEDSISRIKALPFIRKRSLVKYDPKQAKELLNRNNFIAEQLQDMEVYYESGGIVTIPQEGIKLVTKFLTNGIYMNGAEELYTVTGANPVATKNEDEEE
ncbi:MAG: hypothetical protein K6A63_03800 [Acholeplasmatales bacterium]|nr:hypothetical protein [Acholeplasmatales bacterium]